MASAVAPTAGLPHPRARGGPRLHSTGPGFTSVRRRRPRGDRFGQIPAEGQDLWVRRMQIPNIRHLVHRSSHRRLAGGPASLV